MLFISSPSEQSLKWVFDQHNYSENPNQPKILSMLLIHIIHLN